jgi:hypothetical protein
MDTFKSKQASNRMWGLQMSNNITICYSVFADDLGIFIPASEEAFQAVQAILLQYKYLRELNSIFRNWW